MWEILAWIPIAAAGVSALGSLGGALISGQGAAAANAQNIAAQNMWNQQALNAQMAQHGQNTAFMEDQQAFNREERQYAENFNASQADKNRDWQWRAMEYQTGLQNTAYQRAMADMKAAGLNPVLAYQQGGAGAGNAPGGSMASSPGASSGSASSSGGGSYHAAEAKNEQEAIGRGIGNAVSSAVEVMKTLQGLDLMKEQENLTKQKEKESKASETNINQDTLRKVEETRRTAGEADNTAATGELIKAQTHSAGARAAVDANAARVYGKYDAPAAPGLWERIGRILQDAVERGQIPAAVNQYVPSSPAGAPSDFWGTSDKIKERARQNRERYAK